MERRRRVVRAVAVQAKLQPVVEEAPDPLRRPVRRAQARQALEVRRRRLGERVVAAVAEAAAAVVALVSRVLPSDRNSVVAEPSTSVLV